MASKIEQLLVQLEPKFMSQVQDYLEYLVFLQQHKQSSPKATKKHKKPTISALHRFKGDAPFPNVNVSKSDIYEQ